MRTPLSLAMKIVLVTGMVGCDAGPTPPDKRAEATKPSPTAATPAKGKRGRIRTKTATPSAIQGTMMVN